MTEARPIKRKEADAFLSLLCQVFQLDPNRARQVFFNEPMFDLGRKWALFKDGEMVSILTTSPLKFGWGRAFGIAGVATDPSRQGLGYAQQLLEKVIEHGEREGDSVAVLFAHKEEVYRRAGFETVDAVIKGQIVASDDVAAPDVLRFSEVKTLYERWSGQDPARLVRDSRRWKYWKWILRTCEAVPGGYLCFEPSLCREAIVDPSLESWPVVPGTVWLGIESLTKSIGVPLASFEHDLHVMARGLKHPLQMFMTDQF